jgi:hypothetical protein
MPQVTNYPNDESVSLNDKVHRFKTNKKELYFADIVNLVNGVSGRFYSV